jgi:hypothetical protein
MKIIPLRHFERQELAVIVKKPLNFTLISGDNAVDMDLDVRYPQKNPEL